MLECFNGRVRGFDSGRASRTLLLNIHTGPWDGHFLALVEIPRNMLAEVLSLVANFGVVQDGMLGQVCLQAGEVKNTSCTGCFMLMHTAFEAPASCNVLIANGTAP